MPTIKDKTTGEVVSQQPYTPKGTQRASQIAQSDPNWELSYAPNGKPDGAMRQEQMYAGSGKTGYSAIGGQSQGSLMGDEGGSGYNWGKDVIPQEENRMRWKDGGKVYKKSGMYKDGGKAYKKGIKL